MLAGKNVGLITNRQIRFPSIQHTWVSNSIADYHVLETAHASACLMPLYLYPKPLDEAKDMVEVAEAANGTGERKPNLAPEFIEDVSRRVKLRFLSDGVGDLKKTFGPDDVFHYMYAVFHSPAYRARYAGFLKIDYPRLQLTSRLPLFRALCGLGERLKDLHLMEADVRTATAFPKTGDNTVDSPRFAEEETAEGGRATVGKVYINKTQYFGGVPRRAWEFHVGGYQVCHKWLKDRKGRQLSYEDLTHYQRIVAALDETIDLMAEIDAAIEQHGGWPIQ